MSVHSTADEQAALLSCIILCASPCDDKAGLAAGGGMLLMGGNTVLRSPLGTCCF